MTLTRKLLPFGLVILSFISLYVLAVTTIFNSETSRFGTYITIDVLLTIPLIYFLLIRKTNIPKITVIPVLIFGVVLASYTIPQEQQTYLSLFKIYGLPIIELGVLGFIIYKLNNAIKLFKANKTENTDFYSILKKTCQDNLPKGVATIVATEISVFYYGFVSWKKLELNTNEFSYYKSSGVVSIYIAFIIIIGVETFGLHALLSNSYPTLAWILTIFSIYTGFQLFGFVKSILKRPILIKNNTLYLRYGIMREATISLEDIIDCEITSKDIEEDSGVKLFSLLGAIESHNIVLQFKTPQKITGLYGITKYCKGLALSVDDKEHFIKQLDLY